MATFPSSSSPLLPPGSSERLSAFGAWARRSFIAYARWLDGISWRRFFVLSLLAMVAAGVLSDLPPFSIEWGGGSYVETPPAAPKPPKTPKAAADAKPAAAASAPKRPALVVGGKPYEIVVNDKGVHIGPAGTTPSADAPGVTIDRDGVRVLRGAASAASAASAAAAAGSATPTGSADDAARAADMARAAAEVARADAEKARAAASQARAEAAAASGKAVTPSVTIALPGSADTDEIRDAIEEAAAAIEEAVRETAGEAKPKVRRVQGFRAGDHLPPFTFLLIVLSIVTKIMAAGRFKAEAQAVVATEMAESEALKRQVVEARMAAMQAQVEPHFLFNTLASIDHLIETDPPRASKMQRNLIALLRASMPSMREANAQGTRDLGRELAVIKPYLEILKVRMEERLTTDVRVSDGLLSAEFPPMMLQGLVENAIKHGLEPKAEGGRLTVSAEIVHGKLAVTVADSGVGFGRAATAGTGIGLSNIRERLQLLYGGKAGLTVSDTPGGGTTATITVPYITRNASEPATA